LWLSWRRFGQVCRVTFGNAPSGSLLATGTIGSASPWKTRVAGPAGRAPPGPCLLLERLGPEAAGRRGRRRDRSRTPSDRGIRVRAGSRRRRS
jgi:hypothetical protein